MFAVTSQTPHIADARALADAVDLIATFGVYAGDEAAIRADAARGIGNHLHFCHWRQIERLIAILAADSAPGTIH